MVGFIKKTQLRTTKDKLERIF